MSRDCDPPLSAGDFRYRNALGFHQGFQQRHSLRERVRAAAHAAGATGHVEGRAAAGVFDGEVGAIGDQEFDELVEAVFGGAVESGLMGGSVGAWHLTAAPERLGDARRRAFTGSEAPAASGAEAQIGVQNVAGVHVRAGFDEQIHGGEHASVGAIPPARDA